MAFDTARFQEELFVSKNVVLYMREKNLVFLRIKGYSITFIAKSMGRNKGTIFRELRWNFVGNQYVPMETQ